MSESDFHENGRLVIKKETLKHFSPITIKYDISAFFSFSWYLVIFRNNITKLRVVGALHASGISFSLKFQLLKVGRTIWDFYVYIILCDGAT